MSAPVLEFSGRLVCPVILFMHANPQSPITHTAQDFLAIVNRYVDACRAHDKRLLLLFLLALLAALEAVVVGFWFRGGNVFMTVGELGAFSRFWLALSVFAALGLVVYILATSERFHRNAVPKCPRCEVSVRNLDDFLMAAAFPAIAGRQAVIRCDICNHGIAEFWPGAFRAN